MPVSLPIGTKTTANLVTSINAAIDASVNAEASTRQSQVTSLTSRVSTLEAAPSGGGGSGLTIVGPSGLPVTWRAGNADAGTERYFTGAGRGGDLQIPTDANMVGGSLPVGSIIAVTANGTEGVLVTPETGVTLLGAEDHRNVLVSGAIRKLAANTWEIAGKRAPWEIFDTFSVSSANLAAVDSADMGRVNGTTGQWFRHTLLSGTATTNINTTLTAGTAAVSSGVAGFTFWCMKPVSPTADVVSSSNLFWPTTMQTIYLTACVDPVQATGYRFRWETSTMTIERRSNTGGATTNAWTTLKTYTPVGSEAAAIGSTPRLLEFVVSDGVLAARIDGTEVTGLTTTDPTPLPAGCGGFVAYPSNARFADYKLKALV